ncbi:MAG: DUF4143 domain-containing protein [Polyangia bacterium]
MHIRYTARTDPGLKYNHNEDSFCIIEDEQLFLVADGMGAHASGEVASKMAVDVIRKFFARSKDDNATWPYKMDGALSYPENRLVVAIKQANKKIHEAATGDVRIPSTPDSKPNRVDARCSAGRSLQIGSLSSKMHNMWKRAASRDLKALAGRFPAILLLGARQVGKTTLARTTFPRMPYCDLERPDLRALFSSDPRFQIQSRARPGVILDEAQAVPEVFPALRGLIDEDRRTNGRYIILGSAQPDLVRGVSESLAGRVGVLELDPLTASEIARGPEAHAWTDAWLRGGFPDAVKGDFRTWWESFLRTYVERDLPALGVAADPVFMRRLLTMLAHAQGGICNASSLGASLGVSHHTIQRHLDVLERTFLLRRLPPYFRNVGKRLVKSPKAYLRDTGLLHHLLNLTTLDDVAAHPVKGPSWETFVIEEIIRREKRAHPHTQFYFWRTSAGAEVDLVLDRGSVRIAVEVKSGRGGRPESVQQLQTAIADLEASSAWIIDEDKGADPIGPRIRRRGFVANLDWLPT